MDDPMERGVDYVIEATGSYIGFALALELVRPEGVVILKTTVAHPTTLDLSLSVINEVSIIGSRCGPFRPALDALAKMNVDVRRMVTETFELRDGLRALRRASDAGVMKILLHIQPWNFTGCRGEVFGLIL
jgi:threonine dehydrogenase-like Zn-dependent dehydrogenase